MSSCFFELYQVFLVPIQYVELRYFGIICFIENLYCFVIKPHGYFFLFAFFCSYECRIRYNIFRKLKKDRAKV